LGQTLVADRVHAAVNSMQPPAPDPQFNRALADAGGVQLRGRHDTVLALGELRDPRIASRHEKPFAMKDLSCHDANRPAGAARTSPR